MAVIGKTERRLAVVVFITATLPLVAAVFLADKMFSQASAIWFNPEIGKQLDRGVDVTKDYVKAIKDDMRHQTDAIAADEVLREAAKKHNSELVESQIDVIFPHYPELVKLQIVDADGNVLAARDRGRPVDDATERSLDVARPLTDDDNGPMAAATFAIDRKRLDELETTGNVVTKYHQLEASRSDLYQGYLYAFAALLGITIILTLLLGTILARGVTRRINRLAAAIEKVGQGDMTVRVPVTGSDELTDLARTFNRMLGEMQQSRTRIEFLQRMGAWQEMAQRLAHEIKNPLTPIQLAVQECHKKYSGEDPRFRELLDTTLEIVEEEVGTLRRLVTSFSNFARLPRAELKEQSLREFLHDCSQQLAHLEDAGEGDVSSEAANVDVAWQLPEDELRAPIDKQMLRRVIVNLVRNSVQAIRDAHPKSAEKPGEKDALGHVRVSAKREGTGAAIVVEDDGPGIPNEALARVFDPYFTTKHDGSGLGLAIVKKIVVEHGGTIDVGKSTDLGGARFVMHLPRVMPRDVPDAARSQPVLSKTG